MDLRQLRYFVAIAKERHVGRAAQRLHIAQPALSRQVQKLEQELGRSLFIRHPKGVTLTSDGTRFLESVTRLLADFDDLVLRFATGPERLAGEITIATTPAMGEAISLPITRRCAELYPDIRMRIRGAFMPEMAAVLTRGEADLALFNGPPSHGGIITRPLFRERLCVVCRGDDPRFHQDELKVADLEGVPFVMSGLPHTGVRQIVDAAVEKAGFTLQVTAEADTLAASNKLVLAGLGPTIHVAGLIKDEIAAGTFRTIPIEGLSMLRLLGHSSRNGLSPAAKAVSDIILAWSAEVVAERHWPGAEPAGT
jgi:LysR family nitrogen assimilation transcriptional regulator